MYVAELLIQPDDCNHLWIYKNGRRVVELRVWGSELQYLLRGLLHPRLTSSPQYEKYLRTAVLFREKQVDKIVVRSYASVTPPFKYEVKPEQVDVVSQGLGRTTYILKLDNKIVYINVENFSVSVEEHVRKVSSEKRSDLKILSIRLAVAKIDELIEYLQKARRVSRGRIISELKLIKLHVDRLRRLLEES